MIAAARLIEINGGRADPETFNEEEVNYICGMVSLLEFKQGLEWIVRGRGNAKADQSPRVVLGVLDSGAGSGSDL